MSVDYNCCGGSLSFFCTFFRQAITNKQIYKIELTLYGIGEKKQKYFVNNNFAFKEKQNLTKHKNKNENQTLFHSLPESFSSFLRGKVL